MKWQAVTDAFQKAITLPRSERIDFLRQYDEDVRREAESLLKAYEESGEFLEESAVAHGGRELLDSLPGGMLGARLGVFRITRRIGEGGMGEVYEAERVDGEFRQRVAIKIVREDWPDRRRHNRFRAERQILSDLSHPHIARLLDGGATETGAPYLVMELIEGDPIDRYCDSRSLGIAQRLELFGKVCDAVEYANRQGVIHCDIKPGNILVTADGEPKLLDFGISKLLSASSEVTQTRAVTPEYASPEQLSGQPVTAATDVYALGVVLRKLAGGTPALAAVIARATRVQPSERYASAAALREAAQRSATERRSRRGLLAALAGGVAAIGAGGLTWRYFHGSLILAKSEALAVMRIENRTGDKDLDWADRGIADLLATDFAQAGDFEVISTTRSRELLDRLGNDQRRAAEATHAGYYVTGDLLRIGQGLRLNLRVEHTSSGRIQYAAKFDGDNPQAIVSLADQASSAILAQLRSSTNAIPSAARALSSNAKALRLYEEGCDYFDRWLIYEARESFRRAIEIDPKFSMAYYRLALTDPWNPPSSLRDLDRAAELAKQLDLPLRDRQLMEAQRLETAGRIPESIAILREAARRNLRDAEVRVKLGEVLAKEDLLGAYSACAEALAIDPNGRWPLLAASYSAANVGRFSEAVSLADRYIATLKPGDWNGLDLRGDVLSAAERFDEAVAAYEKGRRVAKVAMASMHKGDFDHAESVLKTAVARHSGPVSMGGMLGFLGDIQVGRGNLDGARTWFEQGVRAYSDYVWYGGMVLWKAAQVYLEQSQPETALDLAASLSNHPWSSGVRAVAQLAMNKTSDAEASLTAFHTSVGALLGDYMGARYEELYRILGAFYRGEHEKAAGMADRAPRTLWNFFALAAGRSNLALGRLDDADRHLNFARKTQLTFGMPGLYEAHNLLAFLLGEFYLGQLASQRGQKEEANRKLNFFLKHFVNSPARLPQIKEARAALQG